MINKSRYNIYYNSDGRVRCYDKETKKVVSYPRILMEEKLGIPLEPYEQVHHIDETKRCSGKYGRQEQLRRNAMTECP